MLSILQYTGQFPTTNTYQSIVWRLKNSGLHESLKSCPLEIQVTYSFVALTLKTMLPVRRSSKQTPCDILN